MARRLPLAPSRQLAGVMFGAHVAAAGAGAAANIPLEVSIALLVLIALSGVRSVCGAALLRAGDAVVVLQLSASGTLALQTRRGVWFEGRLLRSTYVSPWLTVIGVKTDGRGPARHVVIFPDSLAPDEFRYLRVWLRWRAAG